MDVGIAMQNAALAAESFGYGIVYCGGVRGFAKGISELLNIPENALFLCGLSIGAVSYTHLDVYKRQNNMCIKNFGRI